MKNTLKDLKPFAETLGQMVEEKSGRKIFLPKISAARFYFPIFYYYYYYYYYYYSYYYYYCPY